MSSLFANLQWLIILKCTYVFMTAKNKLYIHLKKIIFIWTGWRSSVLFAQPPSLCLSVHYKSSQSISTGFRSADFDWGQEILLRMKLLYSSNMLLKIKPYSWNKKEEKKKKNMTFGGLKTDTFCRKVSSKYPSCYTNANLANFLHFLFKWLQINLSLKLTVLHSSWVILITE